MTAAGHRHIASEMPLDRLLGRRVTAANGRPIGRIEEFHAEERDGRLEITEVVLGTAGLLDRLSVAAGLLIGRHSRGFVARWDQLDISDIEHPRLTCAIDELRRAA